MSSDWLLPPDSSSGRKPDPANSVSRADAVPWSDAAGQGEVLRLIEALAVRVEALEQQFAARPDGEVAPAEEAADELTVPDFIPAVPPADPAGATNINRLSFEELRGTGLSVNQAARVIAQRDTRGGFQSLDDLDSLYGIPRDLIEELKRSVTI